MYVNGKNLRFEPWPDNAGAAGVYEIAVDHCCDADASLGKFTSAPVYVQVFKSNLGASAGSGTKVPPTPKGQAMIAVRN